MNDKIENELNLALSATPEELNKSHELSAGFDQASDSWDLIVRYRGNADSIRDIADVTVEELLNGYAILNVPAQKVNMVAELEQIIFVEKPKRLEYAVLNARTQSCISALQHTGVLSESQSTGLYGQGVIVAVADSGIDYTNWAFRKKDGTTRILKLWDQVTDTIYDSADINHALAGTNPYDEVPSFDPTGHGTHVTGIAAGNFAEDKDDNLGIAAKSDIIFVKMAASTENSFPKTTELMRAVDFMVRQALEYNMPMAINLSFGNTYGSHDGTTLISSYIDSVIDGNMISVQIGSGNEGDVGGHAGGMVNGVTDIELQVSGYQKSFNVQLWKNYVDDFQVQIISPSGSSSAVIGENSNITRQISGETEIYMLYGKPKPYSPFQEIYMDFIPRDRYIERGIWIIRIIPQKTVVGRYDLWLPSWQVLNENTFFLKSDPYTTLTIPGSALKAVTVGAYDGATDKMATFSGRGYTREINLVKPDIVAPGVNISSAAVGGKITEQSGTSMATPVVTGSVALMMEWGIVRGNDPFLYGEKVKAYLIKGARHLPGFETWPNPQAGWGALCLRDSIPM